MNSPQVSPKPHPFVTHIASLPAFPGMERKTWTSYTKAQARMILDSFGIKDELPKKSLTLVVNMSGKQFPLVRVTKCPSMREGVAMWAVEFFARSNPALSALRHHVTGAIERGEATPIVEIL